MSAIGTVSQLIGRAIAVKADGSERVLSIGDEVQADELIRVSPDGSLEIKMESGEPVNLEGGQSWLATADTFQESDDFDTTEAIADVQSIQEAILAGADPTEVAEETAAGGEGEADGNEGSSFVQVIATREEVDPTAGFETIGFSTVLDEGAEEEFFDDVPKILGTTTVLLDEDDLVSEDALAAGFETLKTAFEAATGLTTSAADPQGLNDTAAGDDIPSGALTVLAGNLAVDFGANGAGDITFNAAGTQPGGISSGGVGVQYWISEDGHSLVAYTETEDSAEIIFTAQITDALTGEFLVALYGQLDHPDTTTEDNLILDLSFTIQDSDDDTAEGVLRLDIDDDSPVIGEPESGIVDEEGLPTGNLGDSYSGGDVDGAALEVSGDLNINWGADDDNVAGEAGGDRTVVFNQQSSPEGLTSNGAEVQYHISEDGSVLTAYTGTHPDSGEGGEKVAYNPVFTVTLSDVGSGSYVFNLLGNVDHPQGAIIGEDPSQGTEDDINLTFSFTATDADGDIASSGFTVSVDDDAPVIGNQNDLVRLDDDALDGGNAGGRGDNVDSANTTGTLEHSYGADGQGSVLLLDSNAPAGFTYALNGDKTVLTISQGVTAVLQVSLSDSTSGDYTVTQLAPIEHTDDAGNRENNIQFRVDYQVTDSDGDTANGRVNINVDDDTPVVSRNELIRLDDDALDGGNADGRGDNVDSANATGTLEHSYGADGQGSVLLLDSNAPAGFTYALNGDKTVLTISQGVTAVLQVSLSDSTSGDYTVTQLAAIEHADDAGNRENNIQFRVDYQVTDSDGDTANGRVNINVDDDTPVVSRNELIRLDDDALDGGNTGGRGDNVDSANTTGTLGHSYGADGQGSVLLLDSNAPAGFTYTLNGDKTVLTISQGVTAVLQVSLSDSTSGDYTVTQLAAIEHTDDTGNRENNIQFRVDYQVTDSDGDTANGRVNINVDDDTPVVSRNELIRLDDDALDGGNTGGRGDNVDSANTTGTLEHSYGADGQGSVLLLDSNAPAGFTYTLNGDKTVLTISQGVTAVLQVSLSDSTSGDYTVTQLAPIEHTDDAGNRENNIQFRVDYQVTDSDGDTANGRVNINVDDDTPTVEAATPSEISYELTITNHDYESSAGYNSSYGYYIKDADGKPTEGHIIWDGVQDVEATTATVTITGYTPDQVGFFIIPNGNNRNPDLEDGTDVTFSFVGGQWQASAGGTPLVGNGSHVLFDVEELNKDGQDHVVDDLSLDGNQNWEDLQIPNGDGDFNDLNVNVEWTALSHLVVDETELTESDSTSSLSVDYSGQFAINPGADGLGSLDYALTVGGSSGLVDTATDAEVLLRVNGAGDVEGFVNADDVVFTLTVDDEGVATLTQFRAVKHDDPADHDETLSPAVLSAGAITLSAVVTDGDGDSVSDGIDIGSLLAFEDDGPVAMDDISYTDEDTAITIDVLANDAGGADGAAITSYTQPENGTVVLNEDNTFTYTPAVNLHGQESFTYALADGDGDTATATVIVNVDAVADEPTLILSVGEEIANTSPQIIDLTNAATTDNGFEITAYNLWGNETRISTVAGTNHDGFGVFGRASGAHTEIGSTSSASERLKVEFDNTVNSINVNFAWLSGIETAVYTFFLNDVEVGSGTTAFQSDTVDGVFILSPPSGSAFDRVDFSAPLNPTDDYLINSITFDKLDSYSYPITIQAGLNDVDGSETLGDVTLSSLPEGVTYDGSKLTSETPLTEDQINTITASVTSTESSNSDTETTESNAKVEFDGLDATGETADLLVEGTSGGDVIIGGDGDDIIFGKAGDDSLEGGTGADLFVWEGSDVGTIGDPAHDTVTDFNAAEDVLNLTDLLSDGSHSIEGIDNGAGDLQVNIKDSGGNVVQEIELSGVTIAGDASETLQTLLDTGAIDDGI